MDFNENKPIYIQLADQIMDEIERGDSRPGDRLLSVRDYAAKTGVNANTVMRSYAQLQQEGIIYNQRGIGYFYTPDCGEKVLEMRKRSFFNKEIHYFMERLKALKVSPEELMKMYDEYLERSGS